MSRNTHNRQLDHHDVDLDTNVVLSAPIGSFGTGSTIHDVLAGLYAGSGGGDQDLLTGDSSDFASSLGGWSGTGTLTRDTTYALPGFAASAKWVTTAQDQQISVTAGDIAAGSTVWGILFVSTDDPAGTYPVYTLGLGDAQKSAWLLPGYYQWNRPGWVALAIQWTPTSNAPGVQLYLKRDDTTGATATLYIGLARVVVVGEGKYRHAPLTYLDNDRVIVLPSTLGYDMSPTISIGTPVGSSTKKSLDITSVSIAMTAIDELENEASVNVWTGGNVLLTAQHESATDRPYQGIILRTGPDQLGLDISQKAPDTIQLYADSSGTSFELQDDDTGRWKTVSNTGVAKNLNDLTLPSNATPTAVEATSQAGTSPDAARADHVHSLGIGTTKGDILVRDASGWQRLPVGADGTVLTASSAQSTGVAWSTPAAPTSISNDSATAGSDLARIKLAADTTYRLTLGLDASSRPQILLGPGGTATPDILLYRDVPGRLKVTGNGQTNETSIYLEATSGQASGVNIQVAGDTMPRVAIRGDASIIGIKLGPGNAAFDISLRRAGSGLLSTDAVFQATGMPTASATTSTAQTTNAQAGVWVMGPTVFRVPITPVFAGQKFLLLAKAGLSPSSSSVTTISVALRLDSDTSGTFYKWLDIAKIENAGNTRLKSASLYAVWSAPSTATYYALLYVYLEGATATVTWYTDGDWATHVDVIPILNA